MNLETIFTFAFLILLTVFLIAERKRLTIQKVLWPFIYFALYKTKLGLKQMDSIAKKHPRFTNIFGTLGVVIGTFGILVISFLLVKNLVDLFLRSESAIWLLIIIFSFIIVIFGLLSVFFIIYSSFGDAKNIKTSPIVRKLLPGLVIVFMILEWILYAVALALAGPSIIVSVDGFGLFLSIVSMVLILVAIYRDYLFRQIGDSKSKAQEGNK